MQSKTVEVRLVQLSPQSSPFLPYDSSLLTVNFTPRNSKENIGSGGAE